MATIDSAGRTAVERKTGRFYWGVRASTAFWTVVVNALLLFGLFLTAAPYVYMIASTFKPNSEIWSWPLVFYPKSLFNPDLYPDQMTYVLGNIPLYLENYRYLFNEEPFWRWMWNSGFLAVGRAALAIFFSSLAGFALAKYDFKFKKTAFIIILASIILPFEVLVIPLFIQMASFGWLNTYWAIIIPFAVSPFYIFLMRQYMLSVPDELLDAARIDGCTEFGIFWRIVAPIQKPAYGVLAILAFNAAWNDFLWPLIVLQDKSLYTATLGLALLHGPYETPFGSILAGSFIATIPMIIIFLVMQRQFIAGLTAGALKGT
jgi:ABC-type glycerol-3-phosphate transport system permease component